ncbi:protein FAM169B [Trichechus manatus latirostris]|uniref:Protein FAM169B n=1 Tax=Trichechus manatus latirostris TaxID=127582 RepID=A0A2Y9QW74_TRIMA|nr:protein FAM169B [Trichechus manatus latirostris]
MQLQDIQFRGLDSALTLVTVPLSRAFAVVSVEEDEAVPLRLGRLLQSRPPRSGSDGLSTLRTLRARPCSMGRQGSAGIYPVDILEDDPEGLREAALAYYATLGEGAGPSPEVFSLPTGEQVKLEASSVCFCTVHHDEPQHKILVLVNPRDTKTVVAVYIKGSWWPTEDVLRTSDPAREGLKKVQSFGERIVLFILNVVIFGRLERNLDADDMFFLPHSVKEQAKILWRNGAAVGFYTTKMKGSLCGDATAACYVLPVFDTVFVRRQHRRQGLGMALLQDFCKTFREDEALGVSWPISPAMFQVCRKFLLTCPEERGRLWEVEPPGAWGQRVNIWLKIQLQQCQLPEQQSFPPFRDGLHGAATAQQAPDVRASATADRPQTRGAAHRALGGRELQESGSSVLINTQVE